MSQTTRAFVIEVFPFVNEAGVLDESSSATYRRRHRLDCQSRCSAARIGPGARATEKSLAVSQESATTKAAEPIQEGATTDERRGVSAVQIFGSQKAGWFTIGSVKGPAMVGTDPAVNLTEEQANQIEQTLSNAASASSSRTQRRGNAA